MGVPALLLYSYLSCVCTHCWLGALETEMSTARISHAQSCNSCERAAIYFALPYLIDLQTEKHVNVPALFGITSGQHVGLQYKRPRSHTTPTSRAEHAEQNKVGADDGLCHVHCGGRADVAHGLDVL